MSKLFYERLKTYYSKIGEVLRGEADAASIFPNTTDIGMSRERIYAEFLRLHLPSSCNVYFGGFLFNLDGEESDQIDVIVTSDICPQYNFHNPKGRGKSFACIEGSLAVVSLKSNLDSTQLKEALSNLASLPHKRPLGRRLNPLAWVTNYDEWPVKIIYAPRGVSLETLMDSLNKFYKDNPQIPYNLRPTLIHVGGQYSIGRDPSGGIGALTGETPVEHVFEPVIDPTDVIGLVYAVQCIQQVSGASRHVVFDYQEILLNIQQ